MKIGIISDVHSNIQALHTVLDEFNKTNVDKIICCGDIIGIGANPEEVIQEIEELNYPHSKEILNNFYKKKDVE